MLPACCLTRLMVASAHCGVAVLPWRGGAELSLTLDMAVGRGCQVQAQLAAVSWPGYIKYLSSRALVCGHVQQ